MSMLLPKVSVPVGTGNNRGSSSSTHNQKLAQCQSSVLGSVSHLDIYSEPYAIRRSVIISTIGEYSNNPTCLQNMRDCGMGAVRISLPHQSMEHCDSVLANLQKSYEAFEHPGPANAVIADIGGVGIRTGHILPEARMNSGKIEMCQIKGGSEVIISSDPADCNKCTASLVYCSQPTVGNYLENGNDLLLDGGNISLTVLNVIDHDHVKCVARHTGTYISSALFYFPNVDLPCNEQLTPKLESFIHWAVSRNVDIIFVSVRSTAFLDRVRSLVNRSDILIFATIDNSDAVRNFYKILEKADGIVLNRRQLGLVVPVEKIFIAQKKLTAECNIAGKPVICAAQMLESMIFNPRPTRAEASDVANAILDGSDGVMLMTETALGVYPVEAVKMMNNICTEAEAAFPYRRVFTDMTLLINKLLISTTEAIGVSAVEASYIRGAALIITLSTTGRTAAMVAKYRPQCPIITVTRDPRVARSHRMYRGIYTMYYNKPENPNFQEDADYRFTWAMEEARLAGMIRDGDVVIGIQGWDRASGHTNTLRIIVVGANN